MKTKYAVCGALAIALVVGVSAAGFDAYFSDSSGTKRTEIWEGQYFQVAVADPFKTACGIDSFTARVAVFDYKTGAYFLAEEVTFVETGFERGVFVWDRGAIPVGARFNWTPISYRYPYPVGGRTIHELLAYGFEHVTDMGPDGPNTLWHDGNWEYVDRDVDFIGFSLTMLPIAPTIGNNTGVAKRFQFGPIDEDYPYQGVDFLYQDDDDYYYLPGRFENSDTLVVLVQDLDNGYWGQGQMKIARTEAKMSVSLKEVYYGCSDIIITIEDMDESLSSDRPDFVPFFVIVNPGAWNGPVDDDGFLSPNNFCALMRTGGVDPPATPPPPPPAKATIRVTKVVEGDAPSDAWKFNGTGSIGAFTIAASGGTRSFTVSPGTYTITETVKDGYRCTVNGVETNKATVTVAEGETKTVTFVNTQGPPPVYLVLLIDEQACISDHWMEAVVSGTNDAIADMIPAYVSQGGEIHIAVLSFSGTPDQLSELPKQDRLGVFQDMSDPGTALTVVEDALYSIVAEDGRVWGGSAMGDALSRAKQLLDDQMPAGARGVVNLLSPGTPSLPTPTAVAEAVAKTAAKALRTAGYELWTVGVCTSCAANQDFLDKIAGPSPARNFPIDSGLSLDAGRAAVADAERQKLAVVLGLEAQSGSSVSLGTTNTGLGALQAPLGPTDNDSKSSNGVMPVLNDPIRWYNIYAMRYIQYPHPALGEPEPHWSWAPAPDDPDDRTLVSWNPDDHLSAQPNVYRAPGVARATFYAQETGPNTGVFRFNFGSLDQLQERLGFGRFPAGTTIAFYYVDPNDFSDMTLATIHVASPYTRSKVQITDAFGNKVNQVRLGEDALYVRVEDSKQNVDDCLQEWVLVHLCDVHGEDDSEYWKLDEVSADASIFAAAGGMRLEPVWDAVGGYQLVLDDQRFQAFNADTIFVRYNSVRYLPEHADALGSGGPWDNNNGAMLPEHIPPMILLEDERNRPLPYHPWDVAFDMVKVTSYEVFDGTRTTMRFLDGLFNPVTTYRPGDQIYLEVTDLDQNEDSRIRERISGRWDRPVVDSNGVYRDSSPIWGEAPGSGNVLGGFIGGAFGTGPMSSPTLGITPAKVFIFNANTGRVIPVDLMETGPNTGVFKSTTGIKVSDLGGSENDLIVAFYQDPSNHHDIATINTRVVGGPIAPPTPVSVTFDRSTYSRGDTARITVTEPQYAGQNEITGENVLVLKDKDGEVVKSWSAIPAVAGTANQFRVTFTIPTDIATGTIRGVYTHPTDPTRTGEATAQVAVAALENVTGITITPQVLTDQVTIGIVAEPAGAVANRISVDVYAPRGATPVKVPGPAAVTNAASLTWNGGNLGDGAYLIVVTVEGPGGRTWTLREWLYIRR